MATEIRVPTLGESVSEATVGTWFKKVGDAVKADEILCELETDKVTVEVPAPSDAAPVERPKTVSYGFNESALHQDFQWLRTPEPERLFSTTARAGARSRRTAPGRGTRSSGTGNGASARRAGRGCGCS